MTTKRKLLSSIYPALLVFQLVFLLFRYGILSVFNPSIICGAVVLVLIWVFDTDAVPLWKPVAIMWVLTILLVPAFLMMTGLGLVMLIVCLIVSVWLCVIFCSGAREIIALILLNPFSHVLLTLALSLILTATGVLQIGEDMPPA